MNKTAKITWVDRNKLEFYLKSGYAGVYHWNYQRFLFILDIYKRSPQNFSILKNSILHVTHFDIFGFNRKQNFKNHPFSKIQPGVLTMQFGTPWLFERLPLLLSTKMIVDPRLSGTRVSDVIVAKKHNWLANQWDIHEKKFRWFLAFSRASKNHLDDKTSQILRKCSTFKTSYAKELDACVVTKMTRKAEDQSLRELAKKVFDDKNWNWDNFQPKNKHSMKPAQVLEKWFSVELYSNSRIKN